MTKKRKQHRIAHRKVIKVDEIHWTNEGGISVVWGNASGDNVVWSTPAGISADRDLPILYPKGMTVLTDSAPLEKEVVAPPATGEFLIELFCTKNRVDAVMGDLAERFHEHVRSKGERRAELLYWAGVLRSIGPLLWVKVRKAGLIALLLEIGHRC
jgi:hypothetical protein